MPVSEKPELSVLISTYNRKEILLKTLAAYQAQSARSEILEVLVLDDGSSDGTAEAVAQFSAQSELPVRYFQLTHRGPAAVRNYGIREAKGKLILFGDDDILPVPEMVAEHLTWHEKHPQPSIGILGLVEWSPEVKPTPFMHWLAEEGFFDYGRLKEGQDAGFGCFYCGNLSMKPGFLRENGLFDEDFKSYGFEDAELGYRLEKKGMKLLYNPRAVGYHYKFVSFQDACRRAKVVAAARRLFEKKEAGQYLAELYWRRGRTPAVRLKRLLGMPLIPLAALLKPLLDTRVSLPRFMYRKIYYYFAVLPAEREAKHTS
jgi:glycosyltransferase involved in cell wall biosynthesis